LGIGNWASGLGPWALGSSRDQVGCAVRTLLGSSRVRSAHLTWDQVGCAVRTLPGIK